MMSVRKMSLCRYSIPKQ